MRDAGTDVVVTREPGGTPGAEAVRSLLLNPPEDCNWSPLSQTLLFYAARAQHLEQVILPALEQGRWVICDRFSDSTRAYQIVAGGLDIGTLDEIDRMVVSHHQPDLTLILDLPVEDAAKRRSDRGEPDDVFERKGVAFHRSVREAFLEIARNHADRCAIIDASGSPDEILDESVRLIRERLT